MRNEKGEKSGQREAPKCYVCGEPSHIAKFCPNKFAGRETGKGKINAVAGYYSDESL